MADQSEPNKAAPSSSRHDGQGRRSIVFPVLLIGIGSLFLLQNLGIISWNVWSQLWRFWPVLLVLIGLDMLVGRRSGIGAAVVGLITILALVGIVWAASYITVYPFVGFGLSTSPAGVTDLSTELGDLQRATVRLEAGAADIKLSALESASGLLAGGQVTSNRTISKSLTRSNGVGRLNISGSAQPGRDFFFGGVTGEDWDLRLTPKIPLTLEVAIGAASSTLDMRDLKVEQFRIDSGASSIRITTPQSGQTRGVIKTGAASIVVEIPAGVAARIEVDGGLSSVSVDQARFPKSGNRYLIAGLFHRGQSD